MALSKEKVKLVKNTKNDQNILTKCKNDQNNQDERNIFEFPMHEMSNSPSRLHVVMRANFTLPKPDMRCLVSSETWLVFPFDWHYMLLFDFDDNLHHNCLMINSEIMTSITMLHTFNHFAMHLTTLGIHNAQLVCKAHFSHASLLYGPIEPTSQGTNIAQ